MEWDEWDFWQVVQAGTEMDYGRNEARHEICPLPLRIQKPVFVLSDKRIFQCLESSNAQP